RRHVESQLQQGRRRGAEPAFHTRREMADLLRQLPQPPAQRARHHPRLRGGNREIEMSRRLFAGISRLALLVLSTAARAEIELSGVLLTPPRSSFALTEEPGRPATWRALGEKFAGYSLESFDAKSDTLTLKKNGESLRVRLKDDAKVKNTRVEIAG